MKKEDVVEISEASAKGELKPPLKGPFTTPMNKGKMEESSDPVAGCVADVTPPIANKGNVMAAEIEILKTQNASASVIYSLVDIFCHIADK